MSIRGRTSLADPGTVALTLSLTMTVNEWHEVMRSLPATGPVTAPQELAMVISRSLGDAISRIEGHFVVGGWSSRPEEAAESD